ncbi:MAG: class I SAM-dependent methyltransferase, partial [Campylobacter sp.]|nr:class I SAM-dependent methyltransferase [Campylobacter sp.]
KAPNSAKVLEIGCVSGGNLIAQTLVFKDAEFTGIELSKAQIKNGKTALEKIGIKNIDLLCLDICSAPAHFGSQKFDYIIASGVYALHKNDFEALL